jgi:hypothetical protein
VEGETLDLALVSEREEDESVSGSWRDQHTVFARCTSPWVTLADVVVTVAVAAAILIAAERKWQPSLTPVSSSTLSWRHIVQVVQYLPASGILSAVVHPYAVTAWYVRVWCARVWCARCVGGACRSYLRSRLEAPHTLHPGAGRTRLARHTCVLVASCQPSSPPVRLLRGVRGVRAARLGRSYVRGRMQLACVCELGRSLDNMQVLQRARPWQA